MKPLVIVPALGLAGCGHATVLLDGRFANLVVGALFALYAVTLARPRRAS